MKKVVLIANRLNVLEVFTGLVDVEIIKLYVLTESVLERSISIDTVSIDSSTAIDTFTLKDKARVINELKGLTYDILISNGCPFILPIRELKTANQLFINIHPTLLPDLKGKTPLNGVFMTHRRFIGATMHYIDDGIDTGNIIAQTKVIVTPDLDQGLVYKISFDLEKIAFEDGWRQLQRHDFNYAGKPQRGKGSYFNRTEADQIIDITRDDTDRIIDKIKSFNIRGQGTVLTINEGSFRLYAAEKIINPYLVETYANVPVAEIALRYDNKMIIRTMNGMIKLTDYDVVE